MGGRDAAVDTLGGNGGSGLHSRWSTPQKAVSTIDSTAQKYMMLSA
jgi:hypothetical protein